MRDLNDSDEVGRWLADMPARKSIPFSTMPDALYSIPRLYEGYSPSDPASLLKAFDTKIYSWTREPDGDTARSLNLIETISTRLHDTAIDRLIAAFLDAPNVRTIGFMGGHGILRTAVTFRRVAEIARELRRLGFLVVTGGGPGLMEAANLGAFMAPFDDRHLTDAINTLRAAPDYRSKQEWVSTAAKVRADLLGNWDAAEPAGGSNLGIPTWVYGSEPPNLFATSVGKYFYNSLREDGLVSVANGGLVFGKGDAGTVQEVFQNATLNYYRKKATEPTPMVFYDINFWNPSPETDAASGAPLDSHRKPVFPLIRKLSIEATQPFDAALMLSNDPDNIVEFLSSSNVPKAIRPIRTADLAIAAL
ncbi:MULTISPECIES: hypothetical protein [unclassified Bradyrhizobium]|uniref:LOG family protein n=1 Tax=unclassified Bradyrhizobium TaxID=2631580 RepID=UPI002915CEC2|nr:MULTISPECIES: hypothetical protein [unclassified Bradyrhizobium]